MIELPHRSRVARTVIAAALLSALTVLGCSRGPAERPIVLATTTSVGNSGLLDALLPALQADSGLTVRAHLVGSGRALAMLSAGQADVALTHAPEAEVAALADHPKWTYRKFMFNEFVIVGPKADPAGVATAADATEAFRRIARSRSTFISRGDGSGTEEREKSLWSLAGVETRRVVAGAGMGATLRIADQMNAYTLADGATFAQNAHVLSSGILFKGDPRLLNTYAVVCDSDVRGCEVSQWFTGKRGRELIAAYRIGGQPAFFVWPAGSADRSPQDLPR